MTRLILGSGSAIRRKILENAGLSFDVMPADLDEDEKMLNWQEQGKSEEFVARELSALKAQKISALQKGAYVIGCDQMLVCDGRWFARVGDVDAARENLQFLRGRQHVLTSSVAVVKDGKKIFDHCGTARLKMREFSDAFLEEYLQKMGGKITKTVGCYEIEGLGMQLFEKVDGDYFTIMGLPLLPLLGFLRKEGMIGA